MDLLISYNKYIDYSILKPEATSKEIIKGCDEAIKYDFGGFCVPPQAVNLAAKRLKNTSIKVVTVIGFPLGYTDSKTKLYEAEQAIKSGAQELDIVIQIGWAKAGQYRRVAEEMITLAKSLPKSLVLKAILEMAYFSPLEKENLILALKDTPVDFLKTSTGFGPSGAKEEDIKLIKRLVGKEKGVKAAGGIKVAASFIRMIEAGASCVGTSSGPLIMQQLWKG
jgi:deoxyribose-phosphate aldolase